MAADRAARWLPLAIALLALFLTLPNLGADPKRLYPVQGDSAKYHHLGQGLARMSTEAPRALAQLFGGAGFDAESRARYGLDDWIFQHAPIYGWSLAAAYAPSGSAETAGRVVSALFFAGAAALATALASSLAGSLRLGLTRRRIAALLAGLAFVLFPPNLYYATAIMTEIPMAFFLLLAAWGLERTRNRSDRRSLFLGGLALASLLLVKTTFRYAAIPVLLLDLLLRTERAGWTRHLGWRAGGLLAGLTPFWLFLALAHLPFDPLTTSGDAALWIYRGNYVPDRGFETLGAGDAWTPELEEASVRARGAKNQKKALYETAFELTVQNDPVGFGALVLAKLAWFWTIPAIKTDLRFWFGSLPPPVHLHTLLALSALLGAALALVRRSGLLVLALLVSYVSAVHAFSHLVSRYNIPALAAASPLSAVAAVWIGAFAWDRIGRWRSQSPSAWLASLRARAVLLIACAAGMALLALGREGLAAGTGLAPTFAGRLYAVLVAAFVLAVAGWVARSLSRRGSGRRVLGREVAWGASALVALPVALGILGIRWSDPDADRVRVRLDRVGDRVVQTFSIPDLAAVLADADRAELALDLLASPRPGSVLRLTIDGEEIARFGPQLPSGPEKFELDGRIFALQDRYARILRTAERNLEGFVRPRLPRAGFDHYRQWYHAPAPLERLRLDGPIEVALECVEAGGGWVDLFGDAEPRLEAGRRVIDQPAFLVNAFDLSNYRFEFFAHDRVEADARLIRPVSLGPAVVTARRERAGDSRPTPQRGEARMRLRFHRRGDWACRADDPTRAFWRVALEPGERWLDGNQRHSRAVDRDRWSDGWSTY